MRQRRPAISSQLNGIYDSQLSMTVANPRIPAFSGFSFALPRKLNNKWYLPSDPETRIQTRTLTNRALIYSF